MGKKSEDIGNFVLCEYKCINDLDKERVSNSDRSYLWKIVGN